ncbi:hypothetical protein GGR46_003046 [Sphingomonas kyeonggiensis]|uniref:Uncharacterized protein n=1 Tax=Sphingomonas kyeonggiensis TaxID=1268553 RepID=A0A7W6NYD6_9SPHN|nr:hypothetical protein [Sphingomonas kyeonggiensis]
MGGRSGPTVPPVEAGCTRRAATQWKTRASPGLRHAAAGSQGSDAHPPERVPEANAGASAPSADLSAKRCPAPQVPANMHSRIRPAVAAACARARAPAAAAPSGAGRVCDAESKRRRGPWRLRGSPPANSHQISRSTTRRLHRPLRQRSSPEWTETRSDSAPRGGVERDHTAGMRRSDTRPSRIANRLYVRRSTPRYAHIRDRHDHPLPR